MENTEFKVPHLFKTLFVWISIALIASLLVYQFSKRAVYWQRHVQNVMRPLVTSLEPNTRFELESLFSPVVKSTSHDSLPVLYHFWATWCAPCRAEIPTLDALSKKFGSRLKIVAVTVDENKEDVVRFFGSTVPAFQVLWDKSQLVADQWGVQKYPETFLMIPGGKTPFKFSGPRDWNSPEAIDYVSRVIGQTS